MEFNFDLRRLLLLAVLLGGFASLGGFTAPSVGSDDFHQPARVQKAWSYCVILFLVGAASSTIVEHSVGYMDPTNLRPAYIVLGVLLMIGSIFWLKSLKQSVESSVNQPEPGLLDYGLLKIDLRTPAEEPGLKVRA